MTYTERWIRDAVAGGWSIRGDRYLTLRAVGKINLYFTGRGVHKKTFHIAEALLDPLAWQAVGKVKGWTGFHDHEYDNDGIIPMNEILYRQHLFIDLLAEGKTIEEALGEILK